MTLYASQAGPRSSSDLYTIDPLTGVATSIATMSVALTGMALDPTTNVMYGATSQSSNSPRSLVTVDLVTGATTVIGQFLEDGNLRQPADIAFDASGQLWGWSSFTGRLLGISKQTGATRTYGATFIGSVGCALDFDWVNQLYVMPTEDDGTLYLVDAVLPTIRTPVIPGAELAGGAGPDDQDETYERTTTSRTGSVTAISGLLGSPSGGGVAIAAAAMQDDKFYIIINQFGSPVWLANVDYYGTINTIGLTLDGIDALATDDPSGRSDWHGVNPYPLVEDWEAETVNDRWTVLRRYGIPGTINPNSRILRTQVIPDLDDLDETLDTASEKLSWFELSKKEFVEGSQSMGLKYKHPSPPLNFDQQQLVYFDPRGGVADVEYWLAYGFMIPDWSIVWNSNSGWVELPDFRTTISTAYATSVGIGHYLTNDTGPTNGIYTDWNGDDHPITAGVWHELRISYKFRSSDSKAIVTTILDGVTIIDNQVSFGFGSRPRGITWNSQFSYNTAYYGTPAEPPESPAYIDPLVWSNADPGQLFNTNFISPPFIDSTTSVYVPTLSPGAAPLDVPFIDPTGGTFTPSLTFTNIFAPFIDSSTAVFTPRLLSALRARVTQEPVEVVFQPDSKARMTQEAVEVVVQGDSAARMTQEPVEVLVQNTYETINVILLDWQVGSA